jgi:undecaprenyl-diphosphatase
MRLAEAVALGALQGPAELLPISSSAHIGLVLRDRVTGAERKEFEVALHAGTALALAAGVRAPRWRFWMAATAPPAIAGLLFERVVEERLGTPRTIALGLVAGGAAMAWADRAPTRRSADEADVRDGWWLGAAQTLALMPGVSRSGATRAVARRRGFGRADAAALSREVALPVLVGAATLKGARLAARRPPVRSLRPLAAGAAAAAASSWAALRIDADELPLRAWAAYRAVLAAAVLTARDQTP